jgi:hypothetical protein
MLTAAYENLKVSVAPNVKQHVIGIGDTTRALAVEICNLGSQPLKSLIIKYQSGAEGQWFDLITEKSGFTTQTTVLRKWNGDNPYDLAPQRKAALYLDVSEIWALKLEMQCVGERDAFPIPETKVSISYSALKNLGIVGGAIAPISTPSDGTSSGKVYEPGIERVTGIWTLATSQSMSIYNKGTKDGTLKVGTKTYVIQPEETHSWSPPGDNTLSEVTIDGTGTILVVDYLATL